MKTAEQLGEHKTADVPYVPTMDEALAHVKKPKSNTKRSWFYPYLDHLNEYCDADKAERLLMLMQESNSTVEILECAMAFRKLNNNAWKERAEKYRDSFLGVPRHDG